MKSILLICAFVTLVVCVSARPQVTVKYTEPGTTYTGPAPAFTGPPQAFTGPAPAYTGPSSVYTGPAPAQTYTGTAQTYTGPAPTYTESAQAYVIPASTYTETASSSAQIFPSTEISQLHSNPYIHYPGKNYYYTDTPKHISYSNLDPSVKVLKHIYVHVAPEEPEEPRQAPKIVKVGSPQKHYKIIFIKAPTQSPISPVVPIQPPNEEKTLVYVLVKKPEITDEIILPPVPNVKPSKPEVYFIKYKNKELVKPITITNTDSVVLQNAELAKTSQAAPQIIPLGENYGVKK